MPAYVERAALVRLAGIDGCGEGIRDRGHYGVAKEEIEE